ncbi:MAG: T9SS type A sorting domain-containing protein [Bacteroidales bacterium]
MKLTKLFDVSTVMMIVLLVVGGIAPMQQLKSQTMLYVGDDMHSSSEIIIQGGLKAASGKFDNNGTIHLSGSWVNNASDDFLTSSDSIGEVLFNGVVAQNIDGNKETDFYDLTLDNSAGVVLAQNISVDHYLTLSSGDLDLQSKSIDLGTTGSLQNETSGTRVWVSDPASHTGTIQVQTTIDNTTVNPGNLGVEITTTENMGATTIIRGHQQQQGSGLDSVNYSVCRYFDIVPAVAQNADLAFYYWDDELTEGSTSHLESELRMFVYNNNSPGWEHLKTTLQSSNNYVEASSDFFSRFTLASKSFPLPIQQLQNDEDAFAIHSVYPNPAADQINIKLSVVEDAALDLYIYDKQGRKVKHQKLNLSGGSSIMSLDISMLSRSLYLVKIVDEATGQTSEKRFIK